MKETLLNIIKKGMDIESSIPYLFVDDTKIYHGIIYNQDCKDLQGDIQSHASLVRKMAALLPS